MQAILERRGDPLRRAGSLVPLDRQVFEVLAYLLAHSDRVVTRQELFAHLWPERFVSDAALERCITVARRALVDNGREQRCIRTLHRRGYRFVAAVAHYRQALALAEELGMRPLQAHCHLGLGLLYQRVGKRERASAALSTAIELWRAMTMTFWLPRAEAALAKVA